MATPIRQVGLTTDGSPVMAGAGTMMTTHGVPLEVVLSGFKERGWVCDWADYYATCAGDGHNPQTIISRVAAACGDVFGPEYAEVIQKRIEALIDLT